MKASRSPAALRLLVPFIRRYTWHAIAATLALGGSSVLVLALGQGVKHLIDGGFASGSQAQLNTTALAMAGVIVGLAFTTGARFALVTWLGERVGADIRRAVFEHVLTLSPAWFETARTGDVLSRLTADTAVLQALTGSALSQWLRSAVLLVGAFAMLVATSPKLSLVVVAVVPFVVVPLVVFSRRERGLSRVAQERVADLGALAEEMVSALRTVQAFTHEPVAREHFAAATERAVCAAQARIRSRALVILGVILLGFGAITLSLWVGGHEVLAGRMSAGRTSPPSCSTPSWSRCLAPGSASFGASCSALPEPPTVSPSCCPNAPPSPLRRCRAHCRRRRAGWRSKMCGSAIPPAPARWRWTISA